MHTDLELNGKKVTVMGLGLSGGGLGAAKWLLKQGADVTITDLRSEEELAPSLAELDANGHSFKLVLGKHRGRDFKTADLIIKNPAVPSDSKYLAIAKKAGVPIDSEVGLFIARFPGKIIGITGTKGKTTVTSLLDSILKSAGIDYILGGNIRRSPLEDLDASNSGTVALLELSSFQLENFDEHNYSPHIAIWTNIYPDHLDRYKGMKEYAAAKTNIYKNQGADDIFITNFDQKEMQQHASAVNGQAYFYSTVRELDTGFYLKDGHLIKGDRGGNVTMFGHSDRLKVKGAHNMSNVLAAIAGADALKVPVKNIVEAIETFEGVENRIQAIDEVDGVEYINDTASTIPVSTIAALNSLNGPTILIAGGSEKHLPFDDLAQVILKKTKKVILLDDEASLRLLKTMKSIDPKLTKDIVNDGMPNNMKGAVNIASSYAEKGDTVLLSPGCASFGLYKNEYDRGDQFVNAVKRLRDGL